MYFNKENLIGNGFSIITITITFMGMAYLCDVTVHVQSVSTSRHQDSLPLRRQVRSKFLNPPATSKIMAIMEKLLCVQKEYIHMYCCKILVKIPPVLRSSCPCAQSPMCPIAHVPHHPCAPSPKVPITYVPHCPCVLLPMWPLPMCAIPPYLNLVGIDTIY